MNNLLYINKYVKQKNATICIIYTGSVLHKRFNLCKT